MHFRCWPQSYYQCLLVLSVWNQTHEQGSGMSVLKKCKSGSRSMGLLVSMFDLDMCYVIIVCMCYVLTFRERVILLLLFCVV